MNAGIVYNSDPTSRIFNYNDFGHDDDDDDTREPEGGDGDDDDDGCEPEGGDMRQVGASLVDQVSLPAANRRNLENFKTWKI